MAESVAGPSRPKRARKAKAVKDDSEAEEPVAPPKPKRARKSKAKAAKVDNDAEADELANEVSELAGDAEAGAPTTAKVKKPRARKAKLSGFTLLRCVDVACAWT